MNPRIITGKAKNRKLRVPKSARPVTERIKRSIFDTLADRVEGATVADLYAGSGSFGIEALSRGAAHVDFVDSAIESVKSIDQNLSDTGLRANASIRKSKVDTFIKKTKKRFDIIFLDPPFEDASSFPIQTLGKIMHAESICVFRFPTSDTEPERLKTFPVLSEDKMGESTIWYIGYSPA